MTQAKPTPAFAITPLSLPQNVTYMALIGDQGNELPITQRMIEQACTSISPPSPALPPIKICRANRLCVYTGFDRAIS
ncbi:hypothetical protein [Aestuariirhabdus litorea]|uniref:Uncharacterized protein n=1 Tax=Aestuariirhabdus litorea TaxID=2528527 RepID=A0A3P3VIY8_9GAMM|nr:hypothetical protein [Aestuariirhabdus litorea]RRJ82670.1 hypothetical protein D0544_12480 [Aestuariirhabdus litorea]RWW92830.1 hypothetical protein DZC74_12455 [Endozoicomonadaceae bacterium GTF-13]